MRMLDIRPGQGYSGIWEVSYSIMSDKRSGQGNFAWLYINGEAIAESRYETYYGGVNYGAVYVTSLCASSWLSLTGLPILQYNQGYLG